MKNLNEAAKRIKKAEKLVLYTDSDLDGITSGLITKKTLQEIGKEPSVFFTNKESRGYGLNPESVEILKEKSPATLVTMDCGITDFEGIKKAKQLGFEVIVIDHHKPHEKVPEADLIVSPKLHEDDFKERPNAGIMLELSELLLGERKPDLIELTALAIFGDMMPHEGPNEEVLLEAQKNFPQTTGMIVFEELLNEKEALKVMQKAAPILNVTEIVSGVPEGFIFLSTEESGCAKKIAEKMTTDYRQRKEKVQEIKERIVEEHSKEEIIFRGESSWPSFILGKIASQVVSELDKPTFIYRVKGDIAQGSVRVPKGVDAVEAMESAEDILENYGGHPPAAGFTIKVENLEEFREKLISYFKKE